MAPRGSNSNQRSARDAEIPLTIGKLPTETVQTQAKKSFYADKWVLPNANGASRVIFNGPSGSGKTNFALTLLTDNRFMRGYFDKIFVFCPSAGIQADYEHLTKTYTPTELEILDFSTAAVTSAFNTIKSITELCRTHGAPMPQTLFLFDDLLNVPGFDKVTSTLCTKARQWSISVWILSQSLMGLSRLMRLQASNIFAFSPTQGEIERLAAECTNAIANEDLVALMVRDATKDRYAPFHFYKQAPIHQQYRRGLQQFYMLVDPAAQQPQAVTEEKQDKLTAEAQPENPQVAYADAPDTALLIVPPAT